MLWCNAMSLNSLSVMESLPSAGSEIYFCRRHPGSRHEAVMTDGMKIWVGKYEWGQAGQRTPLTSPRLRKYYKQTTRQPPHGCIFSNKKSFYNARRILILPRSWTKMTPQIFPEPPKIGKISPRIPYYLEYPWRGWGGESRVPRSKR